MEAVLVAYQMHSITVTQGTLLLAAGEHPSEKTLTMQKMGKAAKIVACNTFFPPSDVVGFI